MRAETLEATLALPFEYEPVTPFKGFCVYGGKWSLESGGSVSGDSPVSEDASAPVLIGPAGSGFRLVADVKEHEFAKTFETDECSEVSAELFLESNRDGNAALVLNAGRNGIGADAFDGYEIAFYAKNQQLMLGRHEQDFRALVWMPCAIPQDEWFHVKAESQRTAAGNVLRVWLNGKLVKEQLDPNPLPRGSVGIRPWQRTMKVRNFAWNGNSIPFVKEGGKRFEYPPTLEVKDLPPILLVSRPEFKRPPAVGQDFWSCFPDSETGCALKIIEPANPKKEVRTIFSDPTGLIYDANLSFDAKTIFFSYRPKTESKWKIFRIGVDGKGLKQLTFGDYFDFSPSELPTGEIVFVSSRRGGFTLCQPGPTSNLFRMNADGSNLQCVSMNTLSDFFPQVLPDGRVLFTRWEYVDRDLTYRQSLWTQNPDGTGYQLYFGNTARHCGSFLHARPIPGSSSELVVTLAPHHGYPSGAIGIVHRNSGPESDPGIGCEYVTKEFFPVADRSDSKTYRDPFPISAERFLCAGGQERNGDARYRVYLLNRRGERRLLYEDPDPRRHCHCPIPIQETPRPHLIAPQRAAAIAENALSDGQKNVSGKVSEETVENASGGAPGGTSEGTRNRSDFCRVRRTGTLLLVNVYEGLQPWVKPGEAVKIRIMEQAVKTEDLASRAFDQSPVMSYATYYAKRFWGEVPIERDGSAYFEAPSDREIYLQVLDAEGRELQRMTSALQLMPGQRTSCIGCHENRQSAPMSLGLAQPIAAGRAPSIPKMPEWWEEVPEMNQLPDSRLLNYQTLVQPVWDRHCVECHSGKNPAGGYDLTGDRTRFFCMSYENLLGRSRSYRQHDMFTGRLLEKEKEREKPLVHFYWLLFTPSGVNQPLEAGMHASRLGDFLTKEHCGHEIPLADRQRVYLWVDANVPYYSTYANSRPKTPGKRDLCAGEWFEKDYLEVYQRRCAQCHREHYFNDTPTGQSNPTTCWNGRFAWINLTTPENSPALTAHRPEPLGRGISLAPEGEPKRFLFESDEEPDYQKMLGAIQVGKTKMLENPRADQKGFRFAKPEGAAEVF